MMISLKLPIVVRHVVLEKKIAQFAVIAPDVSIAT
jgi:hypothetical protein